MIIVALVLIVVVAVFVLAVVLSSRTPVQLDPTTGSIDLSIFGARLPASELGLVCAGAVAMLLIVVAVVLLRVGFRRARANRKYQKTLRRSGSGGTADAGSRSDPPRLVAGASGATTSRSVDRTSDSSTRGDESSDHRALLDEVDRATGDDPRS